MNELTEGQKLRISRLVGNMKVTQMAKKLGFSCTHTSRLEMDERTIPAETREKMIIEMKVAELWYNHIRNAVQKMYPNSSEDIIEMLDTVLGIREKSDKDAAKAA